MSVITCARWQRGPGGDRKLERRGEEIEQTPVARVDEARPIRLLVE